MYIDKIMTNQVIFVSAETHLNEMTELMKTHALEHLPVLKQNGSLIGMISQYDIQSATPSAITTLSMGEANYLLSKITAQEIMQKEVVSCKKETLIEEAGQLMRKHKISSLPVIEDGQLIGIVTMEDVLDFFLDITGCHLQDATRIAVKISDKEGELTNFLRKINDLDCYIATVIAPTDKDNEGRRTVIVRYYSDKPHEVDDELRQQGFDIVNENFLAEQEQR
ncbi:MAG TPA: CBS domain-containing protein [Leucothrix sp.]|nr:CBS domain-containing protein [Leucothrix sp.]